MQTYISPNPDHVRQTRDAVRAKLAVSLDHLVFDVFDGHVPAPVSRAELTSLTERDGFPDPVVFALHAALVKTAMDGDPARLPDLYRILKDLRARPSAPTEPFTVTAFSDSAMHPDDMTLLGRVFADDVGLTTTLHPPAADDVDRAKTRIKDALDGLAQASGPWVEEMQLLATDIYLAVSDSESDQKFGGAAVFDAFGAILMNPLGFHDAATVMMALVHESSHQQMFLFHLDDPVVLNDADAAYASPLRRQPRPMEGIFHALWVSARMAAAAQDVLTSADTLPWADDLHIHQSRAVTAFRDCEKTVADHAQLTDLGARLFADARAAVNAI